MDYVDYREALGIGLNDQEKQEQFISKIYTYLQNRSDYRYFVDEEESLFCYLTGIKKMDEGIYSNTQGFQRLWLYLESKQKSFQEFLATLIIFANNYIGPDSIKDTLFHVIQNSLDTSHILYDLITDADEVFIIPKGAKELDNALVSQPLKWMKDYPVSRETWIKALKDYANLGIIEASDIAEDFRKALETFFQEFFGGGRSLENYKSDYGDYLKNCGIPKEISANFETLLQAYTNYMNNYAKHHNKTDRRVLEYLLYQSGNIIRLLITLKQDAVNKEL